MKKGITVKFEEKELAEIRQASAEKQTSVSALIRESYYRDQDTQYTIRALNSRISQLEAKLDNFNDYQRKADKAIATLLKELIAQGGAI